MYLPTVFFIDMSCTEWAIPEKNQTGGWEHTLFNCYLAAPWLTLGHSQEESLTNPMLITVFFNYFDPCNEVGFLSPAERLAEFEPVTFQF